MHIWYLCSLSLRNNLLLNQWPPDTIPDQDSSLSPDFTELININRGKWEQDKMRETCFCSWPCTILLSVLYIPVLLFLNHSSNTTLLELAQTSLLQNFSSGITYVLGCSPVWIKQLIIGNRAINFACIVEASEWRQVIYFLYEQCVLQRPSFPP